MAYSSAHLSIHFDKKEIDAELRIPRADPSGLSGDRPPLGSHVCVQRTFYAHHGVYVGNDQIVHFVAPADVPSQEGMDGPIASLLAFVRALQTPRLIAETEGGICVESGPGYAASFASVLSALWGGQTAASLDPPAQLEDSPKSVVINLNGGSGDTEGDRDDSGVAENEEVIDAAGGEDVASSESEQPVRCASDASPPPLPECGIRITPFADFAGEDRLYVESSPPSEAAARAVVERVFEVLEACTQPHGKRAPLDRLRALCRSKGLSSDGSWADMEGRLQQGYGWGRSRVAAQLLGVREAQRKAGYSLLFNNCEHFATVCCEAGGAGGSSAQIRAIGSGILGGASIGAITAASLAGPAAQLGASELAAKAAVSVGIAAVSAAPVTWPVVATGMVAGAAIGCGAVSVMHGAYRRAVGSAVGDVDVEASAGWEAKTWEDLRWE